MRKTRITRRPSWHNWVTPKILRTAPIHRWYLFPHSFTNELVRALVHEWKLTQQDTILDPFVGAGTTLLASKELNIPCMGYDLSPLAVSASNTKSADYTCRRLKHYWKILKESILNCKSESISKDYPAVVYKALSHGRLTKFDVIARHITELPCSAKERDFFRLALIAIIPEFSKAIATGGWLRWIDNSAPARKIVPAFNKRVEMMLGDVTEETKVTKKCWKAKIADARTLPDKDSRYSAIITSPPYPNRHDYTRVFGIELMFGFLDYMETRKLRHKSFYSHPEAKPTKKTIPDYTIPDSLARDLQVIEEIRLRRMLEGYFFDMYVCLKEAKRVARAGARIAYVVGNAQYSGRAILVDELTATLGEQAGLRCQEIRALRWRGNSAQQMGKYGRRASRESIVIFEN